jgi:hypothetical protein
VVEFNSVFHQGATMRIVQNPSWTSAWIIPLALLAISSGCRGSLPVYQSSADAQIRQATDALVALRSDEPSLAGFAFGDSIATNALANRSAEDRDLLLGRVYYDLARKLESGPNPPAPDKPALRAALTAPRSTGRLTRAYFDNLLRDTRSRAASDADFRRDVNRASVLQARIWNPAWDNYTCFVDGDQAPISVCRMWILAGAWYQIFD